MRAMGLLESRYVRAAAWIILSCVFVVRVVALWHFTSKYAVNVMYADQWDFYTPMFNGEGLWKAFDHQHGPHRQGAGFLVADALARMSHWNSRVDGLAVACLLILACCAAIPLVRMCGVTEPFLLLALPLLFLNLRQYDMLIGPQNLSHGAMPMLLFMLYALTWFIPRFPLRLAAISVLNFLLIFTGFGVFVGLITPIILGIELVQSLWNQRKAESWAVVAALLCCFASWALFAHGYVFQPAVEGFRFPYEKPMEYLLFMATMAANFFGLGPDHLGITVGLLITALWVVMCVSHFVIISRHGVVSRPRSVVIFSFCAYTLIYCANTAIGRVFLGWAQASMASRYITLLIPGAVAILIQLATLPSRRIAIPTAFLYLICLAPGVLIMHKWDWNNVRWFSNGRRIWKRTYLATHDEVKANQVANFMIYPIPGIITDRLNYLESHHLNLFYDPHRNPPH